MAYLARILPAYQRDVPPSHFEVVARAGGMCLALAGRLAELLHVPLAKRGLRGFRVGESADVHLPFGFKGDRDDVLAVQPLVDDAA